MHACRLMLRSRAPKLTSLVGRRISRRQRMERRRRRRAMSWSAKCTRLMLRACTQSTETCRSPRISSALFFRYNTALVPPYHVLVDTNFLSFTVQNKLDLLSAMMDCLYAKCIPIITDWYCCRHAAITCCMLTTQTVLWPRWRSWGRSTGLHCR